MKNLNLPWIAMVGVLLLSTLSCSRDHSNSAIVGMWKGTDEYGHEHYYEFSQDGKLVWWDMDRQEDGSFTKRGPFHGRYGRDSQGRLELSDGFQSLGVLTGGGKQLKQDDAGHALRRRLIYQKVVP